MTSEVENIVARYGRRLGAEVYDPLSPSAYMVKQERERALLRWIRQCQIAPVASKRLLEIGCGTGNNFLELLRLGFRPENMMGNDLLPERARSARRVLPDTLEIVDGDALALAVPAASFHIVFQSTVFTSILDTAFQEALARRMWTWVIPGGGVLWYDFVYNNPRNPDVRGVRLNRIRQLFPEGRMKYWRVTLAPPVNRLVTRVHPSLYAAFNAVVALRTHVLCWIQKT
jgi:SAM-dependent methyltransferase